MHTYIKDVTTKSRNAIPKKWRGIKYKFYIYEHLEMQKLKKWVMIRVGGTTDNHVEWGIQPTPPAVEAWTLNRWTITKVPNSAFIQLPLHECSLPKSCLTL